MSADFHLGMTGVEVFLVLSAFLFMLALCAGVAHVLML
jgi:hypothetical protein